MYVFILLVCLMFGVIGNLIGEKRQIGGVTGFILGFFLCAIGLIIVAMSPLGTAQKKEENVVKGSAVDELKKWHDLKVSGAITNEEFEEKKRSIM